MLLPAQELERWFQLQCLYTRNHAFLSMNIKISKGSRNKKQNNRQARPLKGGSKDWDLRKKRTFVEKGKENSLMSFYYNLWKPREIIKICVIENGRYVWHSQ